MDREATVTNGRQERQRPGEAVRRSVSGLLHDMILLGELQFQLLTVDLRESGMRTALALGLVGAAAVLALAALPVLLLAIGWVLVNHADFSHGAAFAIVSLLALLVSAVMGWIGWRTLSKALNVMSRSRTEFTENVRWIKNALKHGSAPPH